MAAGSKCCRAVWGVRLAHREKTVPLALKIDVAVTAHRHPCQRQNRPVTLSRIPAQQDEAAQMRRRVPDQCRQFRTRQAAAATGRFSRYPDDICAVECKSIELGPTDKRSEDFDIREILRATVRSQRRRQGPHYRADFSHNFSALEALEQACLWSANLHAPHGRVLGTTQLGPTEGSRPCGDLTKAQPRASSLADTMYTERGSKRSRDSDVPPVDRRRATRVNAVGSP